MKYDQVHSSELIRTYLAIQNRLTRSFSRRTIRSCRSCGRIARLLGNIMPYTLQQVMIKVVFKLGGLAKARDHGQVQCVFHQRRLCNAYTATR